MIEANNSVIRAISDAANTIAPGLGLPPEVLEGKPLAQTNALERSPKTDEFKKA